MNWAICKPFYNQSVNSKAFKYTIIILKSKIYLLHFSHILRVMLAQDTFSHWSWCWVMSFAIKPTSSGMAKLEPGLGTLLWAFINATWTTAQRKDFWSPFGFLHNWGNRQQYTIPRLSIFMIKLQYHFLPLKLGL